MKKTIVWILILVLLSVASVLATLAFLVYEETAENIMTVGKVSIELLEYERVNTEDKNADNIVKEFVDNKPLFPAVLTGGFDYSFGEQDTAHVKWDHDSEGNEIKAGYTSPIWDPDKISNEIDKMVFVRNSGDYSAYVRVFFAFEAGNYTTKTLFGEKIHLNLNDESTKWKWEWLPFLATDKDGYNYFIALATYQEPVAPDSVTEISLSQIALDSSASQEEAAFFGTEYNVLVRAQAIQSDGFGKVAEDALITGFGDGIPFDMTFDYGVSLYDALHYYGGNITEEDITSKVTSVTFGYNKEHKDIVTNTNIRSVLVSAEQDTMVYAYYVPNSTNAANYDIYVLADKKIYTPKDSTGLFQEMTSLTTVDTTNMDVSRTVNMKAMFMSCESLTSLDVSKWNVSNVEAMNMTFTYCSSLKELNVSSWNVGKVTTMSSMFYDCSSLESLNVTNWNVENVTIMQMLFYDCQKLKNINLSNWQVGNVTLMNYMFYGCHSITSLDIANWDVRKVTTLERFLSRNSRFSEQMNISEIDISGWQTDSLTNMNHMFQGCQKLTSLDMSGWNTSQVTQMAAVFEICEGLKTLNVSGWDVSNVETMEQLFRRCGKLTELDLSKWNTASLKETTSMFAAGDATGPSALETIYVGDGWDMSKVTTSGKMFYGCVSLKGEKNTPYDSAHIAVEYARVDTAENPGYLTYKPAESTTPEQN